MPITIQTISYHSEEPALSSGGLWPNLTPSGAFHYEGRIKHDHWLRDEGPVAHGLLDK